MLVTASPLLRSTLNFAMGDIPRPGDFPRTHGAASPFQTGPTSTGHPPQHQQPFPGSFQTAGYSSVPQQHGYANPQHAFSSQPDASQPQGVGRGGDSFDSFNLNSLGNAFPSQQNRPVQHTQNQQRFSPDNASSTTMEGRMYYDQQGRQVFYDQQGRPITYDHQGRPFTYDPQGRLIALANHQYYTPAGQFFPQPPQQLQQPGRGNVLPYHSNPMLVNQQPSAPGPFYYAQPTPYGAQGHVMPTQQVMPTQYMTHLATQADTGMAAVQPAQYAASSYHQSRQTGKSWGVRQCWIDQSFEKENYHVTDAISKSSLQRTDRTRAALLGVHRASHAKLVSLDSVDALLETSTSNSEQNRTCHLDR